jgi:hypothetical protein
MLWVPEAIVSQVSCDLKLATTILKTYIVVSGLLTKSGTMHKVTIHSTSKEVGMALVVIGKHIAQQQVPNLWRPLKQVRQPTPNTLMTMGRSTPTTSSVPSGNLPWVIQLVKEAWPTTCPSSVICTQITDIYA